VPRCYDPANSNHGVSIVQEAKSAAPRASEWTGHRAPARPANKWLAIASTISWLWTALILMVVASIIVALVLAGDEAPAPPIVESAVLILLAILNAVGAFGVRKAKSPYQVVAVLSSVAAWIGNLLVWRVKVSGVSILINLAVLAIVLLQWRRFE
jgi:hypothetical protein